MTSYRSPIDATRNTNPNQRQMPGSQHQARDPDQRHKLVTLQGTSGPNTSSSQTGRGRAWISQPKTEPARQSKAHIEPVPSAACHRTPRFSNLVTPSESKSPPSLSSLEGKKNILQTEINALSRIVFDLYDVLSSLKSELPLSDEEYNSLKADIDPLGESVLNIKCKSAQVMAQLQKLHDQVATKEITLVSI